MGKLAGSVWRRAPIAGCFKAPRYPVYKSLMGIIPDLELNRDKCC
jgi:hypothetical protein